MSQHPACWLIALICLIFVNGCGPKTPEATSPAVVETTANSKAAEETPPTQKTVELAPPKEAKSEGVPEVKMAEKERATCKVFVGDQFPQLAEVTPVAGKKLHIIAFLESGSKPISRMKTEEILNDLKKLRETAGDALDVIVVQVGDDPKLDVGTMTLVADAKRERFDAVAVNAAPPRLFVLDPGGKILWMDIEYSNSSRDQLAKAVDFLVSHP